MKTPDKRKRPIYLDNQATTPMDPRVVEHMLYYMTEAFGNASSIDHTYGDEAEAAVSTASKHIAELIQTSSRNIIFTSGATESINLALQGHCAPARKKLRIAISPLEHKAVLDTCKALRDQGKAEIIWLRVDHQGRLDLDYLKEVCQSHIDLLCLMAANNEIGNVYPIRTIGKIAKAYEVSFFCDATQAVGKIPIDFDSWSISYLALSAHKMYGPKGSGALIVQPDTSLTPLIYGGGHQKGLRSGTLNIPGIVGLGEACKFRYREMNEDERSIQIKRDKLQFLLQSHLPQLVINGDSNSRLAGNLHISIPGIPNSVIIARVRHKLAISTGSACSSGVEAPSHVLQALQLKQDEIEGALRIGVGKFTTTEEVEDAAQYIIEAVNTFLN